MYYSPTALTFRVWRPERRWRVYADGPVSPHYLAPAPEPTRAGYGPLVNAAIDEATRFIADERRRENQAKPRGDKV